MLAKNTKTTKTELGPTLEEQTPWKKSELTLRGQSPYNLEWLSYWDNRWMDNSVIRKILANSRKNEEYLLTKLNSGNPILRGIIAVTIEMWAYPLGKTEITASKIVTAKLRLNLSHQLIREPGDTKENNRAKCSKAPSASQTLILYPTSLEIVQILLVVIVTTRALFRDFGVPVSIKQCGIKVDPKILIEAANKPRL
jgi:hypothetical protein